MRLDPRRPHRGGDRIPARLARRSWLYRATSDCRGIDIFRDHERGAQVRARRIVTTGS